MATRDYQIRMPKDTTVVAACEQVNCGNWRNGFEIHADEGTVLGQMQAAWIRERSGRTFTEHRSGLLTVFRFERGQRCFAEHRTKPARFLVAGVREHSSLGDWIEDVAEHVTGIEDQRKRG